MNLKNIGFTTRDNKFRPLLVLVSGSFVGHAVTALAMPLLTRLYPPEHFQTFASFNALVAILVVLVTLRYEFSLPLASSSSEANHLLAGVFVLGCSITAALTTVAALAQSALTPAFFTKSEYGSVLICMAPLAAFLIGMNLATLQWRTRQRAYDTISKARVVQSGAAVSCQLFFGRGVANELGLIFGHVSGALVSTLYLSRLFPIGASRSYFTRRSLIRSRLYFKKHWRFPKYAVPEALFNVMSIQVPIIIIASQPQGTDAGLLSVAMYLLQIPILLLGTSFGQFYLGEGGKDLSQRALQQLTLDLIQKISILITLPFLLLLFFSPHVFGFVFGSDWSRSGYFAVILVPCFFMQAISSPISTVLYMKNLQGLATKLQFLGFALRVGGLTLCVFTGKDYLVECYAVTGWLFYTISYLVYIRSVGVSYVGAFSVLVKGNWRVNLFALVILVCSTMFLPLGGPT